MNTTNLFGTKLMATFFALVLSGAMVLASVGPAYQRPGDPGPDCMNETRHSGSFLEERMACIAGAGKPLSPPRQPLLHGAFIQWAFSHARATSSRPMLPTFSDRAEDPSKMIRMIILEMEETLVEVRASAARTIADQKEMRRVIS